MSWLRLAQIAAIVGGELHGKDASVNAVAIDSRKVRPDELFIALIGERFDAHDFVSELAGKAAAALVSQPVDADLPHILVEDTHKALGELAAGWRQQFNKPVIGLTGSNGKTTLKEMVTAILSQQANVLATKGNLNNDIGMPLSLLEIRGEHDVAVIEMGANHFGEIDYLTGICRPDIAIINNAGPAHLEGFGDIKGVSRAKGEIFNGLDGQGIAVINADDTYAEYWNGLNENRKRISFGLENPADVSGEYQGGGSLLIRIGDELVAVQQQLLGRHNAMNALAATAVVQGLNIPLSQIKAGLESLKAVPGRLAMRPGQGGTRLIDDTYNANPASAKAAIDVLAEMPGQRILVLGDMGELGDDARALHASIGEHGKTRAIDDMYCLGAVSKAACAAFGKPEQAFDELQDLLATLGRNLTPDATILVKGSRSMRMERVVNALAETAEKA